VEEGDWTNEERKELAKHISNLQNIHLILQSWIRELNSTLLVGRMQDYIITVPEEELNH
jgi:hypothetical protein